METTKKITDELIDEKLKERGYDLELNDAEAIEKKVLEYYEVDVTESWEGDNYEFYIYEESTADGYSVYVCSTDVGRYNHSGLPLDINSDVYYYDSDLGERLKEAIIDHAGGTIYVYDLDAYFVGDIMTQLFEEIMEQESKDIIDELIDLGYEELKKVEI